MNPLASYKTRTRYGAMCVAGGTLKRAEGAGRQPEFDAARCCNRPRSIVYLRTTDVTPRDVGSGRDMSCPQTAAAKILVRGIRGATTVDKDEPYLISKAVRELLLAMQEANGFKPEELACVFFTLTPDLTSSFAAQAARELGWTAVPLIDLMQAPVETGLKRCIRVLALWNTSLDPDEIRHVYLHEASSLRPDLAQRR